MVKHNLRTSSPKSEEKIKPNLKKKKKSQIWKKQKQKPKFESESRLGWQHGVKVVGMTW